MSFKDKFDKYELLFTPALLLLTILVIMWVLPQMIPFDNFWEVFVNPNLIGITLGLYISYMMDEYWKKISMKTISSFIRLPTLGLILLSALATFVIPSDPYLALIIINLGLGALLSVVCFASFVTYYRSYYLTKK